MKTMLLVTKRKSVQEMYATELAQVFDGYLNIIPCVHPDDNADFTASSGIGNADLVLITNPYSFPRARRQMRENASIINLGFAFARERVDALKAYPAGTEAVACFNFYSSAHQAVNVLYEAGVTNLNLYINYPGNRNMEGKKFDLAIVADGCDELPPDIPQVFDMGPRKVSLTTLLDIAVKANILDDKLEAAIVRYGDTICTPDDYLSYFYVNSAASTLQLKAMMECIDYGIVVYDGTRHVVNFNHNFTQLFGLEGDLFDQNLMDIPWEGGLDKLISSGAQCRNQLFSMQQRSIMVTNEKINKGGDRRDIFILLVKDITELTNLETSLRRQLAKRGHVAKYTFADILGDSPLMHQCVLKAQRIAQIEKPTLIIGESGTGKELFAQSIHNASPRARFPFVAMNCAAIPPTLLESELFGYDEGAFTGAKRGGKEGLFQMAHRGTLFLDEIGELTLPTQAKLLRVLEEKEIMKVGSGEIIGVDVRIVAATNRNLSALVETGQFRLDLFYRLNTLIINVPPLRAHPSDIPALIEEFLRLEHLEKVTFDADVWNFLLHYHWRGNVREVRNCTEYMANICDGIITAEYLPDYIRVDYDASRGLQTKLPAVQRAVRAQDYDAVKEVLTLLQGKSLGRRGIMDALRADGIAMTEYRLRGILDTLSRNEYITFGVGRAGCATTAKAEEWLKDNA